MSFLKSILFAVTMMLLLIYFVCFSAENVIYFQFYGDSSMLDRVSTASISAVLMVVLMTVLFVIVLSIFGSIILLLSLLVGGALLMVLGALWPLFIIVFAFWLMTRQKTTDDLFVDGR